MNKSSVHFKNVEDIVHAMKHVLREEDREPTYLLAEEHRHPSFVVAGSMPLEAVVERFKQRMEGRTGQAKARGSSVFWEGVVVLPDFTGNFEQYKKDVSLKLQRWKVEYERLTGHSVLHIAVHLDEGHMAEGEAHYNEHAHVQIDRVGPDGRFIRLGRSQLSKVQDITAEALGLERGETLAQRGGKRGRKHMNHAEYRLYAAAKSEAEASYEQGVEDGAEAVAADARRAAEKSALAFKRRELYVEMRGYLKGTGMASQAHYSQLKKLYENGGSELLRIGALLERDSIRAEDLLGQILPNENSNESRGMDF